MCCHHSPPVHPTSPGHDYHRLRQHRSRQHRRADDDLRLCNPWHWARRLFLFQDRRVNLFDHVCWLYKGGETGGRCAGDGDMLGGVSKT